MQRCVLQKLRAAPFDPRVRYIAQSGMKLLDQARLTEARLADDRYQLPVALPRALPAPHQHGHFLVATHERGEMALPRAASAAACPNETKQYHRLRHALEFMPAALLGDEQAGDLPLHPRRHHDRTRLGQRLRPRRDIRHVAENFARCIHHHRPQLDGNARGKRGLSGVGVLAVQLGQRPLDRERRTDRALGIILLRHRVAEQRHQAVAELLGDLAAQFRHCRRCGIKIGSDEIAPFLGIEFRGYAGRNPPDRRTSL